MLKNLNCERFRHERERERESKVEVLLSSKLKRQRGGASSLYVQATEASFIINLLSLSLPGVVAETFVFEFVLSPYGS
jgi:hypothetical protein